MYEIREKAQEELWGILCNSDWDSWTDEEIDTLWRYYLGNEEQSWMHKWFRLVTFDEVKGYIRSTIDFLKENDLLDENC